MNYTYPDYEDYAISQADNIMFEAEPAAECCGSAPDEQGVDFKNGCPDCGAAIEKAEGAGK